MYGENRVNRLKIQRLKSRRKTRDIYKVIGCLMPYRLCALTSAQLKLSSVRFMQQRGMSAYIVHSISRPKYPAPFLLPAENTGVLVKRFISSPPHILLCPNPPYPTRIHIPSLNRERKLLVLRVTCSHVDG